MILEIITTYPVVQALLVLCTTALVLVPYIGSSVRKSSEAQFHRDMELRRQEHQQRMLEKGTMLEHDKGNPHADSIEQ